MPTLATCSDEQAAHRDVTAPLVILLVAFCKNTPDVAGSQDRHNSEWQNKLRAGNIDIKVGP